MLNYNGEYGGRVLRAFKADVPWIVGAEIPAEVAMTWPIANRKALFATHKVEWFGPPAGEKAPAKVAKAPAKPKTPAVNKASSTNASPRRARR